MWHVIAGRVISGFGSSAMTVASALTITSTLAAYNCRGRIHDTPSGRFLGLTVGVDRLAIQTCFLSGMSPLVKLVSI
jgi:hypothetical protein